MYRKGGRYGPYWFAYDEVANAYPSDPQHQRYIREYNTRVVKGRESPP